MKRIMHCPLLLAFVASAGLNLNSYAEASPGLADFGKFAPPGKGGEFVEVQLKSNLISLAAQLIEKEEPDVANVIRSLEFVQVNVIGLTDENGEELARRVQKIRADLETAGWERNVNVQGKNGEDIGVLVRTRGSEAIAGVAITVVDKQHVVLANVVGDIKPSQIAALGAFSF